MRLGNVAIGASFVFSGGAFSWLVYARAGPNHFGHDPEPAVGGGQDPAVVGRAVLPRIVVIGATGAGKSTTLNEVAGSQLFETSAGPHSCTAVQPGDNTKAIPVKRRWWEPALEIEVADTPGFPDTSLAKAQPHYDHVIEECNGNNNGVLLVVDQGRLDQATIRRYKVLLEQFVFLNSKLVVLVNGKESRPRLFRSPPDYDKKVAELRETGQAVLKHTGLCAHVIVSHNKDELHDKGVEALLELAAAEPQKSNLQTVAALRKRLAECKSRVDVAQRQLKSAESSVASHSNEIRDTERDIEGSKTARVWAWSIPVVGWFFLPSVYGDISDGKERLRRHRAELAQAEGKRQEAINRKQASEDELQQHAEKVRQLDAILGAAAGTN